MATLDIDIYKNWIQLNGVSITSKGYADDLVDIRNGLLNKIGNINYTHALNAFKDATIRAKINGANLNIDIFDICDKNLISNLHLFDDIFFNYRNRKPKFINLKAPDYNLINLYGRKTARGEPQATIRKYVEFLDSIEGKRYINLNCGVVNKNNIANDSPFINVDKNENETDKYCDILLNCKPQIILQGAPGTGKTYMAERIAIKLTEYNTGEYKIIQFHPAYSYEDFVRGIIAKPVNNGIIYEVVDKILLEFIDKALKAENKKFVLILDEINRANLPAVLGELIFALEYRDKYIDCLYKKGNDNKIKLPKNLFLIGTMNTADRSVGSIDYAIRRRFAFVTLKSDKEIIKLYKKTYNQALALYDKVEKLFSNIAPDFNKDDVMIGHSYFLADTINKLELKLEYEIKPILREYLKDGVLNDKNGISLLDEINNLKL